MTTIVLGKLIGLYLAATAAGMFANPRRTISALDEMARSGPWMLFSGMVATAVGLAIVLSHNIWSGALPVLVTLTGWAALLKGLALLLVPGRRVMALYKDAGFERNFRLWLAIVVVFGLAMAALAFGA